MKKNWLYSYKLGGGIITLNILDNHGLVNVNENKGINPNNISSSETITEVGKYILDATQNNGEIVGSLRNEINSLKSLVKSAYTVHKQTTAKTYRNEGEWIVPDESRYVLPKRSIVYAEFNMEAWLGEAVSLSDTANMGLAYFCVNRHGCHTFIGMDSHEIVSDSTIGIYSANTELYCHFMTTHDTTFSFASAQDNRYNYFKYIIIPIE